MRDRRKEGERRKAKKWRDRGEEGETEAKRERDGR